MNLKGETLACILARLFTMRNVKLEVETYDQIKLIRISHKFQTSHPPLRSRLQNGDTLSCAHVHVYLGVAWPKTWESAYPSYRGMSVKRNAHCYCECKDLGLCFKCGGMQFLPCPACAGMVSA